MPTAYLHTTTYLCGENIVCLGDLGELLAVTRGSRSRHHGDGWGSRTSPLRSPPPPLVVVVDGSSGGRGGMGRRMVMVVAAPVCCRVMVAVLVVVVDVVIMTAGANTSTPCWTSAVYG